MTAHACEQLPKMQGVAHVTFNRFTSELSNFIDELCLINGIRQLRLEEGARALLHPGQLLRLHARHPGLAIKPWDVLVSEEWEWHVHTYVLLLPRSDAGSVRIRSRTVYH